jgi:hypothetical protein
MVLAIYLALGAVVFASRLMFPRAKSAPATSDAPVLSPANEQAELANAA